MVVGAVAVVPFLYNGTGLKPKFLSSIHFACIFILSECVFFIYIKVSILNIFEHLIWTKILYVAPKQ